MKTIFNKKIETPSFWKKWLLVALIFFIPLGVAAKVKKVHWEDQHWTFYINPDHYFLILGPWEDPLMVDHPVQDMWGMGSDLGLCVVYQKGDEFRWLVLNSQTGEKLLGGLLFFMDPDTGYLQWISMKQAPAGGFTVKAAFDTGNYTVFQIDAHGKKTVLSQGKSE